MSQGRKLVSGGVTKQVRSQGGGGGPTQNSPLRFGTLPICEQSTLDWLPRHRFTRGKKIAVARESSARELSIELEANLFLRFARGVRIVTTSRKEK